MPGVNPIRRVSLKDRVAAFLSPPPVGAKDGGDNRPFQPGEPLPPTLDEGSLPRGWVPQVGRNLVITPRAEGGPALTPFEQLRSLAEFDLVRIAISDVVNQILGMKWTVRLKEEFSASETQLKPKIDLVRAWLAMPDPAARMRFKPWLTSCLEDVLVVDALTLLPRRDRAGRPIGLEQVDGTTIRPLVDARGRPPAPPAPAYQQIVYGRPETNFTIDELWYLPRNRRPNTPYGHSPVEHVLLTVNLALRHQLHSLEYYTSGNITDAILAMPKSLTEGQIKSWQQYWDDIVSGRSEKRSGNLRMIPGGDGFEYIATKAQAWTYEFEEWLARVICWAFGVSPMPIAKMMNRTTSEVMEISALESGPRPIVEFFTENVFRPYTEEVLGVSEVDVLVAEDETEEPTVTLERQKVMVSFAGMSVNEWREATGKPRYKDQPNADRPFIVTGMGLQFLDEIEQAPEPRRSRSGDPEAESDAPDAEDLDEDLARWQRSALKRAKAGRPPKRFDSTVIPHPLRMRLESDLRKARTTEDIRRVFAVPLGIRNAAAALRKAKPMSQRCGDPAPGCAASSSAG